jgi:hypothetical protein
VARTYAGILGPLAFLTSLARSLIHNQGPQAALWTALGWLAVLTGVGLLLGWLAEQTVAEGVAGRLLAELSAQQSGRVETKAANSGGQSLTGHGR